MGFLQRLGINLPFMRAGRIQNPSPHLLTDLTCTTGIGDRGLPEARLDLSFARRSGTTNPDMSLAILLDRGGPFAGSTSGQHVADVFATTPPYFFSAPPSILRYASSYGADCELAFYDNEVSFAGPIRNASDFQPAFLGHPPRGHTSQLVPAIEDVLQRLHADRGLYLLVFTQQLFGAGVAQLILEKLQPHLRPDDPCALQVHFVDTGANMTFEDRQLANRLSSPGTSPVHYHRGFLHSREGPYVDPALVDNILAHLDRIFIGISGEVTVGEPAATPGGGTLLRVGNLSTQRWYNGPLCAIGFVPMRAQLALEFAAVHPPVADIVIRYFDGSQHQEIPLRVPLPTRTGNRVSG